MNPDQARSNKKVIERNKRRKKQNRDYGRLDSVETSFDDSTDEYREALETEVAVIASREVLKTEGYRRRRYVYLRGRDTVPRQDVTATLTPGQFYKSLSFRMSKADFETLFDAFQSDEG